MEFRGSLRNYKECIAGLESWCATLWVQGFHLIHVLLWSYPWEAGLETCWQVQTFILVVSFWSIFLWKTSETGFWEQQWAHSIFWRKYHFWILNTRILLYNLTYSTSYRVCDRRRDLIVISLYFWFMASPKLPLALALHGMAQIMYFFL